MNPDPTLTLDEPPLAPSEPSFDDAPAAEEPDNGSLTVLLLFIAGFLALGAFVNWWIPSLILGLLAVLFMHEFGHYITARASGMRVTEFFLGFGPKIWSFHRGETEYGFKAIPAGAYVRIIGMTNLEDIDPADEHRTYRAQPWWQRMVTICAGSAMHFLMAIAAIFVLFGAYAYPGFNGPPWEIARVLPDSSADRMGVEVGDRFTSFDGQTFETWDDFGAIVSTTPVGPVELTLDRDGESMTLSGELGPRSQDVVGNGFGVEMAEDRASQGWTLSNVRNNSNASTFGIEDGDVLLRSEGVARPAQLDFARLLSDNDGQAISLVVLRVESGASEPVEVELSGTVELDRSVPFASQLGVGRRSYAGPENSWGDSVGLALEDFVVVARTNISGLATALNPLTYFGGDSAAPATSGAPSSSAPSADEGDANRPVSIVGIMRLFAESESADEVLYLFMIVNIFIGLFNLVPLLPLDGGHAALATWERVRQVVTRDSDYRVDAGRLIPFTWGVIVLLVGVGIWALVLDIFAWPV